MLKLFSRAETDSTLGKLQLKVVKIDYTLQFYIWRNGLRIRIFTPFQRRFPYFIDSGGASGCRPKLHEARLLAAQILNPCHVKRGEYRRIAFGKARKCSKREGESACRRLKICDTAECNSPLRGRCPDAASFGKFSLRSRF